MAYTRVNWEDGSTSHNTPISAENLNKMDAGIKELDTNKANKSGGDFTGDISVNLSGDASKPYIATDYENGSIHINSNNGYSVDYKIPKIVRTQTSNTYEYNYPDKSGTFVLVDDDNNIDLGNNAIESGVNFSVAEGQNNTLDDNWTYACHVEGVHNTVNSSAAHAEGQDNTAIADFAHAEGLNNSCRGKAAHVEGSQTSSTSECAHAEGMGTVASGHSSHAQNYYTVAGYNYQTAMGHDNDNKSTNLLEVGNGTKSNKSNAMEVTADGDLLIKNGGVSLYGLDENKEILGAKNLLPLTLENLKAINTAGTWSGNAYTLNGVTFTVSTDSLGSVTDITVNGTKEEGSNNVFTLSNSLLLDNNMSYWMTGGAIGINMSARYLVTPYDFRLEAGSGIEVPFERERTMYINVVTAGTYTNVKIYPMIRLASDLNPTYRPYAMGNQELTSNVNALNSNKDLLGVKNLLPLTLENLKAINTAGTWSGNAYTRNGVTFTVNTDSLGSVTDITVNGTTSLDTFLILQNWGEWLNLGEYILSGCPSGGSADTYQIMIGNVTTGSGETQINFNNYGGETNINITKKDSVCRLYVKNATNQVFKPMIRLATDPNPTYRPYAMSNQELTQRLLALEARLS